MLITSISVPMFQCFEMVDHLELKNALVCAKKYDVDANAYMIDDIEHFFSYDIF